MQLLPPQSDGFAIHRCPRKVEDISWWCDIPWTDDKHSFQKQEHHRKGFATTLSQLVDDLKQTFSSLHATHPEKALWDPLNFIILGYACELPIKAYAFNGCGITMVQTSRLRVFVNHNLPVENFAMFDNRGGVISVPRDNGDQIPKWVQLAMMSDDETPTIKKWATYHIVTTDKKHKFQHFVWLSSGTCWIFGYGVYRTQFEYYNINQLRVVNLDRHSTDLSPMKLDDIEQMYCSDSQIWWFSIDSNTGGYVMTAYQVKYDIDAPDLCEGWKYLTQYRLYKRAKRQKHVNENK